MDKKGVSQIITTILIILLVLAAIVIVWQVIERFIERGGAAIEERTQCFDVSLDFVEGTVSCDSSGVASGTVSRGADSSGVISMKIITGNTASSVTTAPVSLGTLTFSQGGGATGSVTVKVAPVVGTDVVCDPTDEVTVTCP
jgi:hypothetical protein